MEGFVTLSKSPHVTQNSRVIASPSIFVSSRLIMHNFFFNCIPVTQLTPARVTRPINSMARAARSIYESGYARLCHANNGPPTKISTPQTIYSIFLTVYGSLGPCMASTDGPGTTYSAISGPLCHR